MIKIRLQRRGRRKRPIHHIVVADSRSPRDGRIIEDLGRFDNVTPKNQVKLNEERAIHWLQQGAQPSDTVRSILKNKGILYKMHLMRWGKSEEEIEDALAEWREGREAKTEKEPSKKEKQQAILEAEEREYQKQLKKKAEEAAKETAKKEALAKAKKEEEAKAEEEKKAEAEDKKDQADAEEVTAKEEPSEEEQEAAAKPEAEEETAEEQEVAVEAEAEETDEEEKKQTAEADETIEDEAETKAEDSEEEKAQADAEETSDEDEEESSSTDKDQTSDEMLAKEAIDHIENTPLKELEGFVTDDEDRVTVQRAWEEKQEGQ